MAEKNKPPPRPLADADARLFETAMKDVTPLSPAARRRARAKAAMPAAEPPPRPAAPPPSPPRGDGPARPGADVDNRTLQRLKRGQIRPEGRLDLHGMTLAAAHGALAGFIARARARNMRCVIVITGTGRYREGGGALRAEAPGWLAAPALRPHVIAFAPARPADGGDGALYVLLRRTRAKDG